MTTVADHEEAYWKRTRAEVYETAIYQHPLLIDFYNRQVAFVRPYVAKGDVLVEVGCGTCKFSLAFLGHVSRIVGFDISEEFLDFVRINHPSALGELVLVKGNATDLNAVLLLTDELNNEFWYSRRVVCNVMNTLGIMPASIRQSVVNEMVQLIGDDGVFFLSVFDAKHFARGVEEYYKQVPQLVGTVTESDVDLVNAEIRVASTGFYSHWFKPDELADLVERAGLKHYRTVPAGIGLFVTGHN